MSNSPWLGSVCAQMCRRREREREKGEEKSSIKSLGDIKYEKFEAKLKRAEQMAYISNFIYSFTWFLGFCALTWASAVILGGLLTELTRQDFYSAAVLLLLESVRLATTTFFGKLVTLKLIHGSADPQRLKYDTVTTQTLMGLLRILEQAVQLTVLAISIIVPIRRLFDLKVLVTDVEDGHFDATKTSLRIFYVLVLVNGSIATLAVMFSTHVVPFVLDSHPLRKYYGKIVWMGMDAGLLHATDFEFLDWAFQVQADEYRSNERAWVVKKVYKELLEFLYYHPKHKGFEAARMALDSSDTFEREAAANIVGLWVKLAEEMEQSESKGGSVEERKSTSRIASASSSTVAEAEAKALVAEVELNASNKKNKTELSRLSMQTKLLAKLADALDSNETGRAASLSFLSLANNDPKCVLMVRSEGKDEKVVDILMDQIHMLVEMQRPNNALTYIKAMIPLLPYLIESSELNKCSVTVVNTEAKRSGGNMENETGKNCTSAKLKRLKQDMWTIVSEYARGLKRLQVVAADVYNLLATEDERRDKKEQLREYLLELPDKNTGHMLDDEFKSLKKLVGEIPDDLANSIDRRTLKPKQVKVCCAFLARHGDHPPLLARRTTTLIASLVTIVIIVVSSSFIIKYGNI